MYDSKPIILAKDINLQGIIKLFYYNLRNLYYIVSFKNCKELQLLYILQPRNYCLYY